MEVLVEDAAGRQVIGAGFGLAEEPPAIARGLMGLSLIFGLPIAEAAGFNDGDEVGAELGLGLAGEGVAGDAIGRETGVEP